MHFRAPQRVKSRIKCEKERWLLIIFSMHNRSLGIFSVLLCSCRSDRVQCVLNWPNRHALSKEGEINIRRNNVIKEQKMDFSTFVFIIYCLPTFRNLYLYSMGSGRGQKGHEKTWLNLFDCQIRIILSNVVVGQMFVESRGSDGTIGVYKFVRCVKRRPLLD